MKKRNLLWLYLFLFVSIIDILFTANGQLEYRYYSKPLIILSLWAYFIASSVAIKGTTLRKAVSAALICSWAGDVLLLFPNLFLYGLGAFLLAHLCYIFAFKIAQKNPFAIGQVNFIRLFFYNLPIYIIAAFVYFLIQPGLGNMKWPVIIYLIVIVMMATVARERFGNTNAISFWQVFIGGLFFVVSDGILAINKFFEPFPESGVLVMGTYILAQLLIVRGIMAHGQEYKVATKK
ncbi:lysoplasmalogenase [Mongoliibacter ruber]|uniref:Putative membrane protein YhhN n=1 Tax=Mongoliibacter ruber TaxID=1750599 RepID=A0A2T0WH62_9BACT|nr:lysoplasmalogenase [Mongoliibacter ruber]PRY85995.1 putative membrane protein YhhN [Mongoliibacter ruber]